MAIKPLSVCSSSLTFSKPLRPFKYVFDLANIKVLNFFHFRFRNALKNLGLQVCLEFKEKYDKTPENCVVYFRD